MAKNSGDQFIAEHKKEASRLAKDFSNILAKGAILGWGLITAATDVDTGRARASWLLTIDYIDDRTKPPSKSGTRVYPDPPKPVVLFNITRHSHLYITNNVEYIEFLEFGTDTRAGKMMAATAIPKINKYLAREFGRLKGKRY